MKKYSLSLTALILLLIPLAAFGEVFYVDTDNVGSPVAMWDTRGTKVWEAEYLPFGEEHTTTKSPQDNKNRFVGKEKDKETGLTYFGARYFDEKSGRFLTPDPVRPVDPFTSKTNYEMLENPQRLNRYAYGLNNPYRFVDPDGEIPIDAVWDIGNIIYDLATGDKTALAADTAALAVPYLPAGITKLGKAAGKLGDASKKGYRAVSDAELDDITKHGFRPHPEGKSMQDKWFSETKEGARKFSQTFPNQKNIVEADVPKSVYDKSYKHPNIDNTGPGFAVPAEELSKVKPR